MQKHCVRAKLFKNGNSQAVRLPKEFRFEGEEVLITKIGNKVILSSKSNSWDDFFFNAKRPSEDFMKDVRTVKSYFFSLTFFVIIPAAQFYL